MSRLCLEPKTGENGSLPPGTGTNLPGMVAWVWWWVWAFALFKLRRVLVRLSRVSKVRHQYAFHNLGGHLDGGTDAEAIKETKASGKFEAAATAVVFSSWTLFHLYYNCLCIGFFLCVCLRFTLDLSIRQEPASDAMAGLAAPTPSGTASAINNVMAHTILIHS